MWNLVVNGEVVEPGGDLLTFRGEAAKYGKVVLSPRKNSTGKIEVMIANLPYTFYPAVVLGKLVWSEPDTKQA